MADVKETVVKVVADTTSKSVEEVAAAADASYIDELGMTSIEIFPIISELEDQLDVEIDFAAFLSQATSVNATVAFIEALA